jgi:hypothetical protein
MYVSVGRTVKTVVLAIALALSFLLPLPTPRAEAASCYGSSCTGLYPGDATGCQASSSTSYYYNGSAKWHGRISGLQPGSDRCNAGWTRVFNNGTVYAYVAGSTRYGGNNYGNHQSEESGGPPPDSDKIAPGQLIYTRMVGPWNTTWLLPCGRVNSSSMISLPVGGSQPATSPHCGHAF